MKEYVHRVQYYETDKMGITHHSNYIRWMEEARVDFLSQIGWDFPKLEAMGIVSPVISISCDFKKPTTFSDTVMIHTAVREFTGVKLRFSYEMKNQNGDVVCIGSSRHAFLNTGGKPIRMKQEFPELFDTIKNIVESE